MDGYGFPTLEGLVGLYSDGVNERGYFMAVLEASRECLMRNHDKFSRTVPMGECIIYFTKVIKTKFNMNKKYIEVLPFLFLLKFSYTN